MCWEKSIHAACVMVHRYGCTGTGNLAMTKARHRHHIEQCVTHLEAYLGNEAVFSI